MPSRLLRNDDGGDDASVERGEDRGEPRFRGEDNRDGEVCPDRDCCALFGRGGGVRRVVSRVEEGLRNGERGARE